MECEVCVDGIHLEYVSEFKYLGCALDESGADETECSRKVASGRRVVGAIRSLVLMHDSETMIWKEKKRSRIRAA